MSSQQRANEVSVPQGIEPIEPWQIISVERVEEDEEPAAWGRDGRDVLAWFDLGEVREQFDEPSQVAQLEDIEPEVPAKVPRILQWFRSLLVGSPRYRLAGNAT